MNEKQTYIDNIRQACIKANKSILDLKMGCEIKTRWNSKAIILSKSKRKSTKTEEWYHYMHGVTSSTLIRGSIIKIIGRDILLSDMLVAILKQNPANRTNIRIECSGQFIISEWEEDGSVSGKWVEYAKETWNLKEPLQNQSPETLKFLSDLLN